MMIVAEVKHVEHLSGECVSEWYIPGHISSQHSTYIHNVTFEIDTGASYNILPFMEYVKATGYQSGSDIKQEKT